MMDIVDMSHDAARLWLAYVVVAGVYFLVLCAWHFTPTKRPPMPACDDLQERPFAFWEILVLGLITAVYALAWPLTMPHELQAMWRQRKDRS